MAEPGALVVSAAVDRPGIDTLDLSTDGSGEIDRGSPPGRLGGVAMETLGDLGPDLETARPDPWADLGFARLVASPGHLFVKVRDNTRIGASPADMSNTHGAVGVEHDAEAIGSEDCDRKTGHRGPERICDTGFAR
jgi:hypothetical protein